MRALLLRLAILLSVVLAGLHMPAMAADLGEADDAAVFAFAKQDHLHANHQSPATGEQSGEAVHHHHCPLAIDFAGPANSGDLAPVSQSHFAATPGPLTSRATAPPVNPPLA